MGRGGGRDWGGDDTQVCSHSLELIILWSVPLAELGFSLCRDRIGEGLDMQQE